MVSKIFASPFLLFGFTLQAIYALTIERTVDDANAGLRSELDGLKGPYCGRLCPNASNTACLSSCQDGIFVSLPFAVILQPFCYFHLFILLMGFANLLLACF